MGITKVENYAWILLLAIGVLFLVGAVVLLFGVVTSEPVLETIIGMTRSELQASNPSFFDLYTYYVRFSALSDLGFAVLITAITVTAYRTGKKWAWYAFWFIPAFFIGSIAIVLGVGPRAPVAELIPPLYLFVTLSVLGQLLSYRKFFGGK